MNKKEAKELAHTAAHESAQDWHVVRDETGKFHVIPASEKDYWKTCAIVHTVHGHTHP